MAGAAAAHRGISYSQLGLPHCSGGHRYRLHQVRIEATRCLTEVWTGGRPAWAYESGFICFYPASTTTQRYICRECISFKSKNTQIASNVSLICMSSKSPGTVSVDCGATCEGPECQISLLNLWIVNSFGQNATFLTGHNMAEQLLGLIGLPSRPSTHTQLCGCPTTKNPDVPLSAGPNWLGRCKWLLTAFKKSDTASAGSKHARLSL